MRLFKKTTPLVIKNTTPSINPETNKWMGNVFLWLAKNFGYPQNTDLPILWHADFFPESFNLKKITVDTLLTDVCSLFSIDKDTVSYELIRDLRDVGFTPKMMSGAIFKSDLEIISDEIGKEHYKIYLANILLEREEILLTRIILELSKVKCFEKKLSKDPEIISARFAYLVSIYFGFGGIISKSLINIGTSYTAGWQANWSDSSELVYSDFIYALAIYSKLLRNTNMCWIENFGNDIQKELNRNMQYIDEHPEVLNFNIDSLDKEIRYKEHYNKARRYYSGNNFSEAIKEYEAGISCIENTKQLAGVNINIGYSYLRLQEYDKSISYFEKASELEPNHGYAYDNMGFAYIMLTKFEKGWQCLEQARASQKNHTAYSDRNTAIYYMKQGDFENAEKYFEKSFAANTPVDLLEYFYAQYLLLKSEEDRAMQYLTMAVEKGEPEAIALMNKLNQS